MLLPGKSPLTMRFQNSASDRGRISVGCQILRILMLWAVFFNFQGWACSVIDCCCGQDWSEQQTSMVILLGCPPTFLPSAVVSIGQSSIFLLHILLTAYGRHYFQHGYQSAYYYSRSKGRSWKWSFSGHWVADHWRGQFLLKFVHHAAFYRALTLVLHSFRQVLRVNWTSPRSHCLIGSPCVGRFFFGLFSSTFQLPWKIQSVELHLWISHFSAVCDDLFISLE